jgi:hypothetical protein
MSDRPPSITDDIEWPDWVERIEVYRDGPVGQFCCNAWVGDDAYWELGEYSFIGWADTVSGGHPKRHGRGKRESEDLMTDILEEIRERVHGYWIGAAVPADELPKHRLVRETVELAKEKGLTEEELDEWALLQRGEPSVAVTNAGALQELQAKLRRPGGALRFRARILRERGKRR